MSNNVSTFNVFSAFVGSCLGAFRGFFRRLHRIFCEIKFICVRSSIRLNPSGLATVGIRFLEDGFFCCSAVSSSSSSTSLSSLALGNGTRDAATLLPLPAVVVVESAAAAAAAAATAADDDDGVVVAVTFAVAFG